MTLSKDARKVGEDLYAIHDDRDCKYLGLEWTINKFVAQDLEANMEYIAKCYDELRERCTSPENKFVYNDLDCSAYPVPWKQDEFSREFCAFVHEGKSRNILFVLCKEDEKMKQQCRDADIEVREDSVSIYQYKSWEYTDLPELETLIENRGSTYNDGRDREFLTSNKNLGEVEDALCNLSNIRWAIFDIQTLWCALEEE